MGTELKNKDRTGEVAQQLRCLPCTQGDLHLNPWNHMKAGHGISSRACKPSAPPAQWGVEKNPLMAQKPASCVHSGKQDTLSPEL